MPISSSLWAIQFKFTKILKMVEFTLLFGMPSQDRVDRRTFTKLAGAGALAGMAGCLGGDEEPSVRPMEVESIPTDEYEDSLHIWNWYVQWVEWGAERFEEEYPDVSTTVDAYSQPSQWYSQIQGGNHEIDSVGTTAEWVDRAMSNDFLEPLPVDRMPNWENIDDQFKEPVLEHFSGDDGGVYALPHSMSVFPTLVYNENNFDSPPTSWDILWDDEYEDRMALMAHYSAAVCQVGALYTGQDPNDPDDFEDIREALIQQKPLNLTYGDEHETHMQMFINEDIDVGTHTSGRINMANYLHDGDHVSWTIPEEGAVYTTDLLAVPTNAPNPRANLNFLNFMLSDEALEEFVRVFAYKTPLEDLEEKVRGKEGIPDALVDDILWDDEMMERLHWARPLDQDVQERYDEIWTEVQAA